MAFEVRRLKDSDRWVGLLWHFRLYTTVSSECMYVSFYDLVHLWSFLLWDKDLPKLEKQDKLRTHVRPRLLIQRSVFKAQPS